jgi:ubiquinone biosynthesis protein
VVIAALIVGAAMLMRVETSARILGYPALAIVCFLMAAGFGVALLGSIVISDRRTAQARRRTRSGR